MTEELKARKLYAKYMAFSTAAEMIRQHMELGFEFQDAKLTNEYKKAIEVAGKKIDALAIPYLKKYMKLGIELNTDTDEYNMDYKNL